MSRILAEQDWSRRLRPLVLGAEPLDDQIRRRWGATMVALGLLVGMGVFLVVVFAGFGHPKIGLALGGLIALGAAQVGWAYVRLQGRLATYRAAHPEVFEPPAGRPSSG